MAIDSMPSGQAVLANLERANDSMRQANGVPADAALVHTQMANMFATCALVAAVQDLTSEVRKLRGV